MDDSPAGSIILFILFVIGSAYFSGSEISFASVNRIHMMSRSSKGDKRADHVLYILDNFDEALSVMLIGNNIMSTGCATLSVIIATEIFGKYAVSVATIITTLILFVFGEMLPKCFARSCNEGFAVNISASLMICMKLFKPLSFLFTAISSFISRPFKSRIENQVTLTEDELSDIVENITNDDDFDEDAGKLVKSALNFSALNSSDIIVEWDKVEKISTNQKTDEILNIVKNSVHSRIPVVDRNGNLKGILQIRKFLKTYIKNKSNVILASVMDYPYYVNQNVPLDDLLTEMSNHKKNLAVVRNEKGEISGILTVEDILEELVGEIYDEDDIGGDDNV